MSPANLISKPGASKFKHTSDDSCITYRLGSNQYQCGNVKKYLNIGGSGFIATHVLNVLLEHGHSVVTTVRSKAKAEAIKNAHPDVNKERLDFFIVEDIAVEGAFDEAVISNPPFEAVIHTSSPYHFNATNVKKDLLDPAVIGTTGLLKSIYKSAPAVKRVVCLFFPHTVWN